MLRRILLPVCVLLAALSLAACGGSNKGSGAVSNPPAAVLDKVDLGQSVQALQTLTSYRFDLSMKIDVSGASSKDPLASALLGALGDIKASGAFVAPDQVEANLTAFGQQFSVIQIGDRAWMKTGGKWQEATADDVGLGMSFEDLVGDVVPDEVLKVAKTSREKVNGVDTIHYAFDKKALEQLLTDFGETADLSEVDTANLDIWLSAENIPVKMTMVASGKGEDGQKASVKLEFNIKDLNDPSIRIRPPV